MYYVEVFEEPEVEVSLLLLLQPIGSEPLNWTKTAYPHPRPAEAPTSADFVLPGPPTYQLTVNEEDFVAYDGRSDEGPRILILATKRNLETLAEYPNWIADGTFYVAPKQFYQSFSIHAVIDPTFSIDFSPL